MSNHDEINDRLANDLMNLYGQQLAWPCEIEAGSFDKKTLKLKMLTIDYVVSDGTHWLCKSPPAQPAQHKPLTEEQIESLAIDVLGYGALREQDLELFTQSVRKVEAAHGIGEKK